MGQLRVGAAVGTAADTLERVQALVDAKVDVIVIDTSHAHSRKVMQTIEKVRAAASDIDLVVGNIATAAAARDLLALGVDGLKVGIGPGSICTTRVVTGAGVPQITADHGGRPRSRRPRAGHRRRRHQVLRRHYQGPGRRRPRGDDRFHAGRHR